MFIRKYAKMRGRQKRGPVSVSMLPPHLMNCFRDCSIWMVPPDPVRRLSYCPVGLPQQSHLYCVGDSPVLFPHNKTFATYRNPFLPHLPNLDAAQV